MAAIIAKCPAAWKSRHGEIDPMKLRIKQASYFNLQYGDDHYGINTGCDPLKNMDDHLALVSCMNKVVSVTQTLCHEAGSLGIECEAIKPPKGSGDVDCILWYYGDGGPHLVYGNQTVFNSMEQWYEAKDQHPKRAS